jgi:hypothetical protein
VEVVEGSGSRGLGFSVCTGSGLVPVVDIKLSTYNRLNITLNPKHSPVVDIKLSTYNRLHITFCFEGNVTELLGGHQVGLNPVVLVDVGSIVSFFNCVLVSINHLLDGSFVLCLG